MLFNSLSFAIFLSLVFIVYWLLPHKCRWICLLVASYYFYMGWNVECVVLIFITTIWSWLSAILIEKIKDTLKRKVVMGISILGLLVLLFIFKYFNFVFDSVTDVLKLFSIQMNSYTLQLIMPVGISYYTFQMIGYIVDVYRGEEAEKHFGRYAVFISFFPRLVSGPIERSKSFLPQLKESAKFDCEKAMYGLKLIGWGLLKKVVIADLLAGYVDSVYRDLSNYRGFSFLIVTFFYAIQIYCDFSGYSDVAIGSAKLLGIDLIQNFVSPYFATSVKEFWRKWHISLSMWFRDYLYIPLGGSRCGKLRHRINIMVIFLVSGLWHGANWTFVLWGAVHGIAQICEDIFSIRVKKVISIILTFLFCSWAWIFFRAKTIGDAFYIIKHSFDGLEKPLFYIKKGVEALYLYLGMTNLVVLGVCIFVLGIYDYLSLKTDVILLLSKSSLIVRWIVYYAIGVLILVYGIQASSTEFIYFQF